MDLLQAMRERHSVRSYTEQPIEGKIKEDLTAFVEQCSRESGLHLQLVLDEPNAFQSLLAHYGKFSGVRNYIVLAGRKGDDLDEKCGYYGEKIVNCNVQLNYKTDTELIKQNELIFFS